MLDFNDKIRNRAFEIFRSRQGYSEAEARRVWDRMNGGRLWYYWEAEKEENNVS